MPVRRTADKFLTGDEFKIFRLTRGLTQQEIGDLLGITKQAVANYEVRGIDRLQALAVAAIDRGLRPWKPTKEDIKHAASNSEESNDKQRRPRGHVL